MVGKKRKNTPGPGQQSMERFLVGAGAAASQAPVVYPPPVDLQPGPSVGTQDREDLPPGRRSDPSSMVLRPRPPASPDRAGAGGSVTGSELGSGVEGSDTDADSDSSGASEGSAWEPAALSRGNSPFSSDAEEEVLVGALELVSAMDADDDDDDDGSRGSHASGEEEVEEGAVGGAVGGAGRGGGAKGKKDKGPPPVWHSTGWCPRDIPFTAGTPGPQNAAAALQSDEPVDFFELLLSDELLEEIRTQTNLYAEQKPDSDKKYGRAKKWKAVDLDELKRFLGLFLLTGISQKPEIAMYWSTDEYVEAAVFRKVMPRNRFQAILSNLHFVDNTIPRPVPEKPEDVDKLWRVRPILQSLLANFQEMYLPSVDISLDEGMLLWRGRLEFKVYAPQKPVKYGIRSYILCDSATGYLHNMLPYCKKKQTLPVIITTLLGSLAGCGYRLYMDNLYNSVDTAIMLLNKKTYVCGTLRKKRGQPPAIADVTPSKLPLGSTISRHSRDVMVLAWRAKKTKIVTMISTLHPHDMLPVSRKEKKHSKKVVEEKPVCVIEYNKHMNGVDKLDQNLSYYMCTRKTRKWTKKFFFYMLQITQFNAYVIYKARHPAGKIQNFYSFILAVVKSWTTRGNIGGVARPQQGRNEAPPAEEGSEEEDEDGEEGSEEEQEDGAARPQEGRSEAPPPGDRPGAARRQEGRSEAPPPGDRPRAARRQEGRSEAPPPGDAPRVRHPLPPNVDPESRLNDRLDHELINFPKASSAKKYPQRCCRVCSRSKLPSKKKDGKNIRSETSFECKSCRVPLHHQCTHRYHTVKDY